MKIKKTTYHGGRDARKEVSYTEVPDPKPTDKQTDDKPKAKPKTDKKADA
jgi:hypothetical protein